MKNASIITRLRGGFVLSVLITAIGASVSCMTTYDSAGRPVESVDPGVAVAGAAAAGLLGYALANDNDNDNYYHHRGYYQGHGHYRPPHRKHHRRH